MTEFQNILENRLRLANVTDIKQECANSEFVKDEKKLYNQFKTLWDLIQLYKLEHNEFSVAVEDDTEKILVHS